MTTLTVTATQTAATANGILLRVKVLTSAALVQNGATVATALALNGSITTTVTGSLVYGALSGDSAAGAFVAEPLCTLIDNFLDSPNAERYGSFRTTSPTGTPGSTLVGSTTANANRDMAAVEILPNGTITEDASGPAVATATGAITVTSASFTPPGGALLVAIVGSDGAAAGTPTTMSVTDTGGGLTWTQVAFANSGATCYAGVWLAQVPGSVSGPPIPLQPGGKTWRRKHRRPQLAFPVTVSPDLTVNAGLATAAGAALDNTNASGLGIAFTAALAPAAGIAGQPNLGINTGLATATGTAGQLNLGINIGLATGTGLAGLPNVGINAGLATGTGTARQPNLGINTGLATATGAAAQPGIALTPGLATGLGSAGLPNLGINIGLATATGTAAQPATPRAIGLATGTGSASLPNTGFNIGLATGTGTAFNIPSGIPAGLATATGSAGSPATAKNIGLATATGAAGSPVVGIYAGLATGTGAATQSGLAWTAILAHGIGTAAQPTIPRTIGLATGAGTAGLPNVGINIGLARGAGTAFDITRVSTTRHNVDYTGSTLTNPNTLGGTISIAALGGTLSVATNTLGGTASINTNTLGGTISVGTLGGTAAVTSDTLTGTLSVVVNALGGTDVTDKMQEVDITLNEFNDATVTFQILNNGSPDNITGMTVNALFKKTRGDLDSAGTTKTYSSAGGSPAITIVTPTTGSCTLAVPDADVIFPNWTFYRIDVVNGTVTTTAIFGTVTIMQL